METEAQGKTLQTPHAVSEAKFCCQFYLHCDMAPKGTLEGDDDYSRKNLKNSVPG